MAICRQGREEFDLLVTTDKQLQCQQNLAGRRIAILILPHASWIKLQTHAEKIAAAVTAIQPGSYIELRLD